MESPVDLAVAELLRDPPHHGPRVRADTVRPLRERVVSDRAIVALEYDDDEENRRVYAYGIARDPVVGWRLTGGVGCRRQRVENGARALFTGWWSHRGRDYGAVAIANSDMISRVRVVNHSGDVLEDRVESGVALLLADAPFQFAGAMIETYGGAGDLLERRPLAS